MHTHKHQYNYSLRAIPTKWRLLEREMVKDIAAGAYRSREWEWGVLDRASGGYSNPGLKK